jgi:predicted cupin superfamily sugar epimerase
MTAQELVTYFNMQAHPEGGWFKETYRSKEAIEATALPDRFPASRFFSTAIYFLLDQGNFSAFHRIKSDECWHFYAGGPLDLYMIHENGRFEHVVIGSRPEQQQHFQFVVPAGCWFASRPSADSAFSFVGCTVAPGFDFNDFELAEKDLLLASFPQHSELITALCRS